ncbi:MAG: hypothetical protein HFJ59_08025 [Clostridia bacterium]|nr:hypothetical protein [Clostridia bacterium]
MAKSKYQYGTSPRKIEPDYQRRDKRETKQKPLRVVKEIPKQQVKISNEQRKRQVKTTFLIIGLFLLLLTISCRNSQIDKSFNQIQEKKKQLSILQKENEQLKVGIENSLNPSVIEKIAREELGMQKLSTKQTVYITLPKKDYVESASEKIILEEEKSWWEELLDKIFNF